ncbi:CocE/NonD family hydrolase [Bradyrhizobium sp.]|uniref:alpha/beta hydrolase family protein n=1 Tax=Bradyrhizobium sp. TaxID=376 RepID=UPI001D1F81DA|nr:CocE/NonD family hydrolase [Bradyrhizobium sp.]MBI5320984.1 alpha/beta hydrolase [Bradyrhizobium sp.]
MKRAAWLALALALAATWPAAAQDYIREDLRIPLAAAGPGGLEALLIRPAGVGPYPLALISHGSPPDPQERPKMSPYGLYRQAIEFARRGFAALVVMRRGYGESGGVYAERTCCSPERYSNSFQATSTDLRAAIAAMKGRAGVTTQGMIAVGTSAGGLASVALAADPPPGLAAVINFAGGRRWRKADGSNIQAAASESALVNAYKTLGASARTPTLWLYAADDSYFGPELVRRMHDAFTAGGGRAQLISLPAFGDDGHYLFSRGIPTWTPLVDDFLRERNLGRRELLPPPAPAQLPSPPRLGADGRAGFANYLSAGPHKAFAVSPKGSWASRSGLRSADEARAKVLETCSNYAPDCTVYAVDDALADSAR